MKHSDGNDEVKHEYGSAPVGVMDPPTVVLPRTDVFGVRAKRLRELSGRVASLREFLGFMARVALAQDQVLASRKAAWLPKSSAFELALEHGMAPLGIHALRRDVDWQSELVAILDALELNVGTAQRQLLTQLRELDDATRESLADAIFEGQAGPEALRGLMPLVAAALQVAWVRMAQTLPSAPKRASGEARTLCPCCGSAPVASVIHIDSQRSGVRYLHCGICATEWHLERAKCSVCDSNNQLNYLGLEDSAGKPALPMQAETCGDCHSYMKIVSLEWNASADPLADDLASLALDLMLAEEGEFVRSGFNPFLIVGD